MNHPIPTDHQSSRGAAAAWGRLHRHLPRRGLRDPGRHRRGLLRAARAAAAAGTAVLVLLGAAGALAPLSAMTMESPEWKALIAAAKTEGALSVAGYGSRSYAPVYKHFGEKYGISMTIQYAGGREHATRILAERSGGIYAVDVGHVGANTVNRRLIPAGALTPIRPLLVLDEVTDPKNWYGERLWFTDPAQKYVFAHSADFEQTFEFFINTKVVKPSDLAALKSPHDLLLPKWRKKIVALSPMLGQSGNSYFRYTLLPAPFGPEWMEKFIKGGNAVFVTNSRLIENGLAGGKYAFAIFPHSPPLDRMERQGLPIKRVEQSFEGAPGIMTAGAPTQTVQVYDRAPHPNAAKLFVNWLLSREGMTYVHDHVLDAPNPRNSLRKDVPKTNVRKGTMPEPGKTYFAVDLVPKYQSQRQGIMKKVQGWYKESLKK